MKDPEIRALLRPTLPSGLAVDELEIRCRGDFVRADVVHVSDALHGYEIKGASDSRVRLPRQVAAYSQVFDRCTLVTEPRHVAKALPILPAWWGVLVAEDGVLRECRAAAPNPGIDPTILVRFLWRGDAAGLMRAHGVRVPQRALVSTIWPLATQVPIDALRTRVCEVLRARCEPGGLRDARREQRADEKRERAAEAQERAVRDARFAVFARMTEAKAT